MAQKIVDYFDVSDIDLQCSMLLSQGHSTKDYD